ncbi:hypothetical protein [Flavilitoribacter nigricans]|uniref:hypothetical protein n=1 Tax=Flavilitoribacter nigricans TaxID=70997 RepID=UPI00117B7010|nr:hypothetical protein [Flavilitoribacter nigricans]
MEKKTIPARPHCDHLPPPENDYPDQAEVIETGMQLDPNFFCLDEDDKERCLVQCPFCERV